MQCPKHNLHVHVHYILAITDSVHYRLCSYHSVHFTDHVALSDLSHTANCMPLRKSICRQYYTITFQIIYYRGWLTRANGVVCPKHMQSSSAETEMLNNVKDFLWFGDISWRKEEEEEKEEGGGEGRRRVGRSLGVDIQYTKA